jgi:hypothetical protein
LILKTLPPVLLKNINRWWGRAKGCLTDTNPNGALTFLFIYKGGLNKENLYIN